MKRKFCMRARNPYPNPNSNPNSTLTLTLTKLGASSKAIADNGHVIYNPVPSFVPIFFPPPFSCLILAFSCLVLCCVLFPAPQYKKHRCFVSLSTPNLTSFPFLHQKPIELVRGQAGYFKKTYEFQIKDIVTLKKVKGREGTGMDLSCRAVSCHVCFTKISIQNAASC
jgi:hypothetical protein